MTESATTDAVDRDGHEEFQAVLDRWASAIVANDADAIAGFAEPDWELVTPESGPVSLDRFLALVRDGSLTHAEMSFDVRSVRRHGDLVTVVAHGTNRGEFNGEPFTANEWVTETFIRRPDGWRCVISALTPRQSADG